MSDRYMNLAGKGKDKNPARFLKRGYRQYSRIGDRGIEPRNLYGKGEGTVPVLPLNYHSLGGLDRLAINGQKDFLESNQMQPLALFVNDIYQKC